MANPPITIGPFANVPAPGSPMKSDWPQQITTAVCNPAKVQSALLTLANGTYTTEQTLGTVTITAATFPRLLIADMCFGFAVGGGNVATVVDGKVACSGFSTKAIKHRIQIVGGLTQLNFMRTLIVGVAAGASGSVTATVLQVSGGGLAGQVFSDLFFNTLDVVLLPYNTAVT